MIIDFHTHTFPDELAPKAILKLANKANLIPSSDGTITDLKRNMQKNNVDYSVILPVITNIKQTKKINDTAIYINNTESNIISFGGIHPDDENYKDELKRLKNNNIKGIKIHPDYQNTFFDDIKYINIIDYAFELGLMVIIHAGVDIGYPNPVHATVNNILNVLNKLKNKGILILAHMGNWMNWEEVYDKLAGLDIYFDTAFSIGKIPNREDLKLLDEDLFIKIVKKHGADKILFATDSPWGYLSESIKALINFNLSDKEKNMIFGENAQKLLML